MEQLYLALLSDDSIDKAIYVYTHFSYKFVGQDIAIHIHIRSYTYIYIAI